MSAVATSVLESREHGWSCEPCGKSRWGCTSAQHAINSANLHNRQHHPEPALNLSALARVVHDVVESEDATEDSVTVAWEAWKAITGLSQTAASQLITAVLQADEDVVLHVAPF